MGRRHGIWLRLFGRPSKAELADNRVLHSAPREGAVDQRVKVPPEEFSVHLGSGTGRGTLKPRAKPDRGSGEQTCEP